MQPVSPHGPGEWMLAGVADDAVLAETMAGLLASSDPLMEARMLSHSALFHKAGGADRERIVALLESRTTADIERGEALRPTALAQPGEVGPRLADAPLTRSGSPLTEALAEATAPS